MRKTGNCWTVGALYLVAICMQGAVVSARSTLLTNYSYEQKYPWINRIVYNGKASAQNDALGSPEDLQCGFTELPRALRDRAVLLPIPQFESSDGCGRCLEIRCTDNRCPRKTSIRAIAAGVCADCSYGWLGMDPIMYYAVTGLQVSSANRKILYKIEWQYTECQDDINGDVRVSVAKGSTKRWLSLTVENGKDPIHGVTASLPGDLRVVMTRDKRNRFLLSTEDEDTDIPFPLTLIIDSQAGRNLLFDVMEFPGEGSILVNGDQFGKTDEEYERDATATAIPELDGSIPHIVQAKRSVAFETKSTGGDMGDGYTYNIWSNGYIEGPMLFSRSTRVHVELKAQLAGDEPPRMQLSYRSLESAENSVSGEYFTIGFADVRNSEEFVEYTFGVGGQSGLKALRIQYINDFYDGPNLDRNLLVGEIRTSTTDEIPNAREEQLPTDVLTILQQENILQLLRAAQFEVKTTGISSTIGDESWSLWDPGYIETTMIFTRRTLLTLEMRADPLQGWPTVIISIGGVYHSSVSVQEDEYRLYSVVVLGKEGQQPVSLSLADTYHDLDLEQSRFLHVRKVYTGSEVLLEVPEFIVQVPAAHFSTKIGTGHAITDEIFSFDGNGLIAQDFNFGTSGNVVLTIEMQSNFVEGWPTASVQISGRLYAVIVVDSSYFTLYSQTIYGLTGPQTVMIEFNSAHVDGLQYDSEAAEASTDSLETVPPVGHRNLWVRNVRIKASS